MRKRLTLWTRFSSFYSFSSFSTGLAGSPGPSDVEESGTVPELVMLIEEGGLVTKSDDALEVF